MKVTRAKLVDLFEALGYATARQWKKGEMRKRLAEVVEMAGTEGFVFENATEEQDGLLSALVEAKGEVELVSEAAEPETAATDAELEQVVDAGPEDESDEGSSPDDVDEEPEQPERPVPEPPTKAGKKKRGGKKAKEQITKVVRRIVGPDVGNPKGVKSLRNRLFCTGIVLKEKGLADGITDELVKEVSRLCNSSNHRASESQLRYAWHVVNGFLNG